MESKKVRGWEGRLITYLSSIAGEPFTPGKLDCALLFADAVEVMTGFDPAEQFRGRYKTLSGGLRLVRKLGFNNHVEYIASLFEQLPSPLYAQRGDAVEVIDGDGLPALGIVQGTYIYVMGDQGLKTMRLTDAVRAFRI